MSTVTLRHPSLPADQEIEVDAGALPHYAGAGWQEVPAEELEKRAALKVKAQAEAAAAEEQAADEPEQSEPAESTDRPARSRTKTAAKKNEEES
ncbi:hypothetical protein [Streptomyces sp.]|uniref:hypothetical protein n=1 Tax=Streptomyces sp. TaxID=1931 RepID=UPI002F93902E